jgi:hypothetical protein
MKRTIYYPVILLFFSACAFHGGMMTTNTLPYPESEILRVGSGSARTVHILGIGGLDHKSLMADAKKNLYANNPLKKGETYANLAVNTRVFPWLPAFVTELTVTADIVKLQADSEEIGFQSVFEPPLNEKGLRIFSEDDIWVKRGDEVLVYRDGKLEKATVIRVLSDFKIMAQSSLLGIGRYGMGKFFLIDENIRFKDMMYQVGGTIPLPSSVRGDVKDGTILGFNHEYLLIQIDTELLNSPYRVVSISDLEGKW